MRRMSKLLFVVVVVASSAIVQSGPAQADHLGLGAPPVFEFDLSANGTPIAILAGAGVYNVTVTGAYDYDIVRPGAQLADAECSTDTPLWDGVVDQIANGLGLYPTPLSQWQRWRFGFALPFDFFTNYILEDTLDVYIDAGLGLGLQPAAWAPLAPTLVDAGGGVVAGCDTTTHAYETVVVGLGDPITFRIFDVFYPDNLGSLHVKVHQVV